MDINDALSSPSGKQEVLITLNVIIKRRVICTLGTNSFTVPYGGYGVLMYTICFRLTLSLALTLALAQASSSRAQASSGLAEASSNLSQANSGLPL